MSRKNFNPEIKKKKEHKEKSDSLRKKVLKNLLFVIIGILLFTFKPEIRVLRLLFAFSAMYLCFTGFIKLLISIRTYWDHESPIITYPLPKNVGTIYFIALTISFFFLLIYWQGNVLRGQEFFLLLYFISIPISTVLALTLHKITSLFRKSTSHRFYTALACFTILPLAFIGVISHLNISLNKDPFNYCENVKLINAKSYKGGRNRIWSYNLKLFIDSKTESFSVSEEEFNELQNLDSLEICTMKGYFGYEKIDYIGKPNKQSDF